MKVNIKEPKEISFDKINIGSLFYLYHNVYLRIIPVDEDSVFYNAVNLEDGSLEYVDSTKLVQKLDGELNVNFASE